ncbi:hypothetical protein KY289_017556 [Solanum tuberosum]|nr:hypothetical protein KY284_017329 [Solanum tuberosum]KAH0690198.1 hypothetical protein KY289_017556 [Solanum tuberosum]
MEDAKQIDTSIVTATKLDLEGIGSAVEQKLYRVWACVLDFKPTLRNLTFKLLKGTTDLGLLYLKGSNFELIGYAGANYAGYLADRKVPQGWTTLVLQGNRRREIARKATREFYINVVGSVSSILSSVGGVSFTLKIEILEKILGVPNLGWCHYVKRSWPPLEGLSSALEISRRFANDPTLKNYTRVDKGTMLSLYKLLFDGVHKIILPRKQKHTEANYLDLTLMELLISQVPIEEWQEQTIKDVLGVVDHAVIPMLQEGQMHLCNDQLHIDYGLEHARLAEENSRLKEELEKTQAALNTERSSNSDCLKHLYEILTKGSHSLSFALPPSV